MELRNGRALKLRVPERQKKPHGYKTDGREQHHEEKNGGRVREAGRLNGEQYDCHKQEGQ
jgi:hypothetical protein